MLLGLELIIYRDLEQIFYFEIWERISEIKTRIGYINNRTMIWLGAKEIQLEATVGLERTFLNN